MRRILSRFRFAPLRGRADRDAAVVAAFEDPARRLVDSVRARIARFTPAGLAGDVVGHLVVGGTSGGFALGDPEFFPNVDRYPSAPLAATVMQHELYHAVQALARSARSAGRDAPAARAACLARVPHGDDPARLFESLQDEGTASLVGDVLALPAGVDSASDAERAQCVRNVGLVGRSVTQLELSVHGTATGADVAYDDVYALGFYGDEVLYALGYVMGRARSPASRATQPSAGCSAGRARRSSAATSGSGRTGVRRPRPRCAGTRSARPRRSPAARKPAAGEARSAPAGPSRASPTREARTSAGGARRR